MSIRCTNSRSWSVAISLPLRLTLARKWQPNTRRCCHFAIRWRYIHWFSAACGGGSDDCGGDNGYWMAVGQSKVNSNASPERDCIAHSDNFLIFFPVLFCGDYWLIVPVNNFVCILWFYKWINSAHHAGCEGYFKHASSLPISHFALKVQNQIFHVSGEILHVSVLKWNWSLAEHPYSMGFARCYRENSYKSERWFLWGKSFFCSFLLHIFISSPVGNVPTLLLLGLIRNFFISEQYPKYSVDMLVNRMRSLLTPGFWFSSDYVNQEDVLAGFAILIKFSLVLIVFITP